MGSVALWHVGFSQISSQTQVSWIAADCFTTEPPGKPNSSDFLEKVPVDVLHQVGKRTMKKDTGSSN